MGTHEIIRRAQVYGFLAGAFLYPEEDWTEDMPVVADIARELGYGGAEWPRAPAGISDLQAMYRRTFGVTGSLCYETECGLPHEFRQSQELADINGFYHAFGFTPAGQVRERPDHVAAELEFMYALALKEAYAAERGMAGQVDTCVTAGRMFLQDHLGRWIGLLAQALARSSAPGPYPALAAFAAAFVEADAKRLGVQPEPRQLSALRPTPPGPTLSCEGCPAAELLGE
jgi:DMSO reductase family type II enzyme chaperone